MKNHRTIDLKAIAWDAMAKYGFLPRFPEGVVREKDGMVVLAGCGHSGILNMVKAAQDRFPDEPVKAVVGGFHLIDNPLLKTMGATPGEVREMARRLDAMGCRRVITGHCTGEKAARILKEEMGDRLEILHTGFSSDL